MVKKLIESLKFQRGPKMTESKSSQLASFVKLLADEQPGQPIQIIEIGSWLGDSAIVWAEAIREHNCQDSRVICIDPWAPYEGRGGEGQKIPSEMSDLLSNGEALSIFNENILSAGIDDIVEIRQGFSDDILPSLPQNSFDIIYVDGDHSYRQVFKDIENSKPLIREGGILCGDDLEILLSESNWAMALYWSELGVEYETDSLTGHRFHPGVTTAVSETLGDPSKWGLVWGVRKKGADWLKFDSYG